MSRDWSGEPGPFTFPTGMVRHPVPTPEQMLQAAGQVLLLAYEDVAFYVQSWPPPASGQSWHLRQSRGEPTGRPEIVVVPQGELGRWRTLTDARFWAVKHWPWWMTEARGRWGHCW